MVESKLPDFPYGPLITCIIDSEAAVQFSKKLIRSGQVDQLADQGQIDGLKAALNYSASITSRPCECARKFKPPSATCLPTWICSWLPPASSYPTRDQPFDETPPVRPDRKGVVGGLIQAGNLCGLPAISIPCGYVNGLPIGLQIVGRPFSENRIIAFAREFQSTPISTNSIHRCRF